jgi:protein Mpv17
MVLSAIRQFGRSKPILFGCGVSALKTSASDFITQRFIEEKETIDWRRNGLFFFWGCAWLGGVQYLLHVHMFTKVLFPTAPAFVAKSLSEKLKDRAGQLAVVKQVSIDQFVFHPFVVFPVFYQVKEFIEGGKPADGLSKCLKNWTVDCQMCWSIWVPTQLFNMSICPLWMRVPFTALVSFGFTMLLSFVRGAPETLEDKAE